MAFVNGSEPLTLPCRVSYIRPYHRRSGEGSVKDRRPLAVMACCTSAVGLALTIFAGTGRAEQVMVRGMGRTQGWVVATDDGELGFMDCQGRQSRLGDARVEATSGHCRMSARPLEIPCVVRSIDPGLRILRAVDDAGRLHTLYVPEDAGPLHDIHAGERIRVTSPVAGQASRITRP